MTRYIKGYKFDYPKIRQTFPRDPTYKYDHEDNYECSYVEPIVHILPRDAYMTVKNGVEADGKSLNLVLVLAEGYDRDELEARDVSWNDENLKDIADHLFTLGVWPDHDTYDYAAHEVQKV